MGVPRGPGGPGGCLRARALGTRSAAVPGGFRGQPDGRRHGQDAGGRVGGALARRRWPAGGDPEPRLRPPAGRAGRARVGRRGADLPAERAGDEPLLLARRLPGVAVVVGADRLAAGRWAVAHVRPDVVLLDDGFQQRRLLKDVEIVCLDARAPWGPGGLLPRGTLREPPSALARAHLVIATRAAAGTNLAGLLAEIRQHAGRGALPRGGLRGRGARGPGVGRAPSRGGAPGRAVLAFAGIAAPERLAETLAAQGAVVRDLSRFPITTRTTPRDLRSSRAAGPRGRARASW